LLVLALILFIQVDKSQSKSSRFSESNDSLYPNFRGALVNFYGSSAISKYVDNGKVINYRIDILLYKRVVGKVSFLLGLQGQHFIQLIYKGKDGVEIVTSKYYLSSNNDVNIEEYENTMSKAYSELVEDPR